MSNITNTNLDKIFDALRSITHRQVKNLGSEQTPDRDTYLIVGLGNPGREYKNTRHNIGFLLIDRLADRLGVTFTRSKSKSLITNGRFQGRKIILVKPQTFMNRSGQAVSSLLKFYKLKSNHLLVVYDDVDLPFDSMRMKSSGGSAGHKGMQSIIEQLGTNDLPRLRMGVGRPPGYKQAANYVLKPFNKDEAAFLDHYIDRAADSVQAFLINGIEYAMTHYNRTN